MVDPYGTLYGAYLENGQPKYVQEGRLDYEECSVTSFQLWGSNTCQASRPQPYELAEIYCVTVPYDSRSPRRTNQRSYMVSKSYVLYGIEFDFDDPADRGDSPREYFHPQMGNFADWIYQAQRNRYAITEVLIARSGYQPDKSPYLVYGTMFSDSFNWNTITDKGRFVPSSAAMSLKAAMGMWVLWNPPYTDHLLDVIESVNGAGESYYEGLYENDDGPISEFTANDNGTMLEMLLFKKEGKLLQFSSDDPKNRDFAPLPWDRKPVGFFKLNNDPRNCPSLSNTPTVKTWCEQTRTTQHTRPAYQTYQCAACRANKPVRLPPVTAQCLRPQLAG